MTYIKKRITPTDWERILKDLKDYPLIIDRLHRGEDHDFYECRFGQLDWAIDDANNSYLFRMPGVIQSPLSWHLFYFNNTAIQFGLGVAELPKEPGIREIKVNLMNRIQKIENPNMRRAMQLAINKLGYDNYEMKSALELLF